ncbi:hypothetical protein Tco_0332526 [Tanacetum coccineum]
MEQYLALIQYNIRPGIVKPEIGSDVKFEINGNFMSELRRKLFKGTDDEDAHGHVRRVLEIVDLFHFPSITHDAVMLRVFPITLSRPALRRKNSLSAGLITTWDLLEKVFIRYNDLLFRCPQHDLNNNIFYTGFYIPTCIRLDSKGFIPLMSPAQALKSIQVMADHSHNWYDEATTRESINDSSNNVDTKKLKENIHAIQVSHKICEGAHPTNDCPLTKEDKVVEQSKYIRSLEETIIKFCKESIKKQAADDEWIKKFIKNTDSNIRVLKTTTKNLQEKADQLTQTTPTNSSERVKVKTKIGKKDMEEPVPRDLPVVQPYIPPTLFPGHLKKQKDEPYKTREIVGIPEEIHTKKAQEEEGDMDDGWDIMIKDVERIRQILIPSIHTLPNLEHVVQLYMPRGPVRDEVKVIREKELEYDIPLQNDKMQSLTPQTVYITPLDDDYVALATSPILEKHLNKFGEEISDITRVVEKADGNLVNDVKELSDGLEVGSIRRIQGIRYGVLEFLGVGTTFDIFQNLHILYLQYGVLIFSGYDVLSLFPLWSFGECRHGYAVSSLMDTAYWLLE